MDIRIYNSPEGPIFEEDDDFIVKTMISEKDYDLEEMVDIFSEYSCFDESQSLYGKERFISLCFQTRSAAERFVRRFASRRIVIAGRNRVYDENDKEHFKEDEVIYEQYLDELWVYGGLKGVKKAIKNATEYILFLNGTPADIEGISFIGLALDNDVTVKLMPRAPLDEDLDKFDSYIDSFNVLKCLKGNER